MDRGAWRATVHEGLKESDSTEATKHTQCLTSYPPLLLDDSFLKAEPESCSVFHHKV